jgi:hypothetical protein
MYCDTVGQRRPRPCDPPRSNYRADRADRVSVAFAFARARARRRYRPLGLLRWQRPERSTAREGTRRVEMSRSRLRKIGRSGQTSQRVSTHTHTAREAAPAGRTLPHAADLRHLVQKKKAPTHRHKHDRDDARGDAMGEANAKKAVVGGGAFRHTAATFGRSTLGHGHAADRSVAPAAIRPVGLNELNPFPRYRPRRRLL